MAQVVAGGGGDAPNKFNDGSGGKGEGGAATLSSGSATVVSGTTITITVGSGAGRYTGGSQTTQVVTERVVYARITYGNVYPYIYCGTLTLSS